MMFKNYLFALCFCFGCLVSQSSGAVSYNTVFKDTVAPAGVMEVIHTVLSATDNFKIEAIANLYTPNAVVADDEAPFSWNGPTAGAQWVDAVERACKERQLTEFKAATGNANVCLVNADNVYIIIPVVYTAAQPDRTPFLAKGTFTFVLRQINGKWLIKSQAWTPQKALDNN
jgi:ketosteroid isomerase-like protein